MAKVYDALRRAEEERKRQMGESAVAAPSVVWDAPAPPSSKGRASLWKRLRRRNQRGGARAGADDINKRRISLLQPDSYVAEQYRSLRGRIDAIAMERPIKTISCNTEAWCSPA